MNLDITFCSRLNCKNKECIRNQWQLIELADETHPISMANFENCEFWEE